MTTLLILAATIVLPVNDATYRGKDAELANAYCLACHSVEYVETQPPRLSGDFWKGVVVKMQKVYGAPIPDDQVEVLASYFAREYNGDKASPTP